MASQSTTLTDSTPPSLAEMTARYLARQLDARALGLAAGTVTGEVVPHEAVPVQTVEPRLAWDEAVSVLKCFPSASPTQLMAPPPDWATLVACQEPAFALAFCAGNFPQLVRNLLPLMRTTDLSTLQSTAARPASISTLTAWAAEKPREQSFAQTILGLGVLRLGREFDEAAQMVHQLDGQVPGEWQAAWANEKAALLWHRGQPEEALALWQGQTPNAAVLFNRGMATLFLGKPKDARPVLTEAVAQIPEERAWHHLGRLYLALAEMRGG
jgi:hypothetical protein